MGDLDHPRDRITQIRILNFRSLADVTLDLDGLSVLIGDNGSGKSSIIEAIETVRYFGDPGANVVDYFREHTRPVRADVDVFAISVRIEGNGSQPVLHYHFSLRQTNGMLGVQDEHLNVGPIGSARKPLKAIKRTPVKSFVFDQATRQLTKVDPDPNRLLLSVLGSVPMPGTDRPVEQQAVERVATVLRAIEVHVPFEVMPAWAARRTGRRSASREPSLLQPVKKLDLLAGNLGNVYHSLKNDYGSSHWNETMDYVRLGLGNDIDDVVAIADAAGGQHAIAVRYKSMSSALPSAVLSDGTLAYLAFVGLVRLPSQRTLLAFDEPELHLHPALLTRVVSMFETMSQRSPVILTTHSDRVLDVLREPAKSTVLCELDEQRATRLLRPNPEMLAKWLTDFRGLGELRAAGLQPAVMEVREPKV